MYEIQITRQAQKSFTKILKADKKLATRIANAIERIAENPDQGIALKGELSGVYKYRVGSYRILYQVKRSKLIVTIIDLGSRKDIYR